MQKTCLNCTHVGVCSKRMQFIVLSLIHISEPTRPY